MDNQLASEPQENLMRGLLRAYYWMDESLQNGLAQAGLPTRTRTQTMILINVSNGVTRAAELARILGISRQAVQQQVNELEKEDIVTQIPDPSDKRANRIVFSEKGAELINVALESLQAAEGALAERIGPDLLHSMRQALMSDWGSVVGEQRAPGRKRSIA
ncbi:MAG: MarR family transcriptional regulator [Pseudomonadota bacterium]